MKLINFKPTDRVKTCPKLEAGLRFGPEGVRACQLGPFAAPVYWSYEDKKLINNEITKEDLINKRRELFNMLNSVDDYHDLVCKKCEMVEIKEYSTVTFDQLGTIDHSPRTVCNLRCDFCGFTQEEAAGRLELGFVEQKYNSLPILELFEKKDVRWDSWVDFNGGETSLLKDIKKYLDFFEKMKIRVLLFTNSVKFSEPIYKSLENGSIQWVVTSIDAGTQGTYKKTKIGNQYEKVLENCTRYAYAASKNHSYFAIKYIFTENNSSDDDVIGFVYAVLAIRPQKIWLTFDFTPFAEIPPDSNNFGKFDFTKQIKAYTKMYLMLKKHGVEAVHYTEGHLAKISKPGKKLLELIHEEIKKQEKIQLLKVKESYFYESLKLEDFRIKKIKTNLKKIGKYSLKNSQYKNEFGEEKFLEFGQNDTVVIAPASPLSSQLLEDELTKNLRIIGFVDRNKTLYGKNIKNIPIQEYKDLNKINPSVVLIYPPKQHEEEIIDQVLSNITENTKVILITSI